MSAQLFELLRQRHVILQRIFRPRTIENVPCVTNGRFTNRARFQYRVDRNAHVIDGIKRIKNSENVDALPVRLAHKFHNRIVGIRSVANGIRPAQQHLKTNIRHTDSQVTQPLPRVFMQKT